MHELGIIVHISRTLDGVAKENGLTQIRSVTLEVGEVSSIVPAYMTDCWKYYCRKSQLLMDSDLKIEILPAVTLCETCHETYSTVESGRQCPVCGSWDTVLVTGNQCNIKEIEAY